MNLLIFLKDASTLSPNLTYGDILELIALTVAINSIILFVVAKNIESKRRMEIKNFCRLQSYAKTTHSIAKILTQTCGTLNSKIDMTGSIAFKIIKSSTDDGIFSGDVQRQYIDCLNQLSNEISTKRNELDLFSSDIGEVLSAARNIGSNLGTLTSLQFVNQVINLYDKDKYLFNQNWRHCRYNYNEFMTLLKSYKKQLISKLDRTEEQ